MSCQVSQAPGSGSGIAARGGRLVKGGFLLPMFLQTLQTQTGERMVKVTYEPTPLSYFVSAELAFWNKLLVTVERLLKGAVKDLDKYIDGLLRNEDFVATLEAEMEEVFGYPVGIPDIREDFEEEYRELREFFPGTLRQWFFVAIYAFIERVLFEACRHKEREAERKGNPLSQSVEDFFDKRKSYLTLLSANLQFTPIYRISARISTICRG